MSVVTEEVIVEVPVVSNSEPDNPFELRMFGGANLLQNNQPVRIRNRKALALLCYLAWIAPRAETRERLAGLLWSESDEQSARTSLRQTLRHLRMALDGCGFPGIDFGRGEVGLSAAPLTIDALAALENGKHGEIHEEFVTTERIAESILYGFEDLDPMFRSWLMVQRKVFEDQLNAILEKLLAEDEFVVGEQGRRAATALHKLDPTNELACRSLMQNYATAGDIAASLRCYNSLYNLLEDEFDMPPSQETQDLAGAIKSGSFEEALERPNLPAHSTPAPQTDQEGRTLIIRVLPFDREKAAEGHSHLVQGMRKDLIARLVRFREWSVMDEDGIDGDAAHLSSPNAARSDAYEVDGTAFPERERIRLVVTLKDMRTRQYIWSDWFYLQPESWFQTQSAVVRRLAIAVNVQLSAERLAQMTASNMLQPKLHDRWLMGQELSFRWRPDTEDEAEQIFHEIIDEAPDFAPAFSSLVQIINSRHLIFPGVFRSPERSLESIGLAKTAVMLDPLDSRSHLCLAWSNAMVRYFGQAELSFRLACDLNENDPWSLVSASLGLAFCDELSLAEEMADQALGVGLGASRLHWGYQTCVRFLAGDFERAVEAANSAQDMMLGLPAWKAAALYHLGRHREASDEAQRFLSLVRDKWVSKEPPTDETIVRWFLQLYPIRRRKHWQLLYDGLAGAGAPMPDTDEFNDRYPA